MQAICKFKCFFRGRSTLPGEVFTLTPEEAKSDHVKSSFTIGADQAEPAAKKPSGPPKDELSDEEMKRRLAEWGVAFPAKIVHADLIKLYTSQAQAQEPGK